MGAIPLRPPSETNLRLVWGDIPDWSYDAVLALMQSLKKADMFTFEHCLRVGEYSGKLAKAAGLNEYEQKVAEFAGMLHDIGKMGISSQVIHKPSKLTHEEYEHMKAHPIFSAEIIKPLAKHEFFRQVVPVVKSHHEFVNGNGYPDKLVGDEIPLLSRVILIVDTLDAMSEDRPYRKGLPIETIYQELKKFSGTQFDPQLVKDFLLSHGSWKKEQRDQEIASRIIHKVA